MSATDTPMQRGTRPLLKASSLVLNVAATPRTTSDPKGKEKARGSESEIIPDSEEERVRLRHGGVMRIVRENGVEVIEISSDEEEFAMVVDMDRDRGQHDAKDEGVLTAGMPGGWKRASVNADMTESDSAGHQPTPRAPKRRNVQTPRARRIVQSSSSESEPRVLPTLLLQSRTKPTPLKLGTRPIVDLTSDSPGNSSAEDARPVAPAREPRAAVPKASARPANRSILSATLVDKEAVIPLFADGDDEEDNPFYNDGSVLTLEEPRSTRKPIRKPAQPSVSNTKGAGPSMPHRAHALVLDADSDSANDSLPSTLPVPRKPATVSKASSSARAPRLTKKALAAAETARREQYARELFAELNRVVFKGGIPSSTQLAWNKRLLTTAGRAKWHRSREGAQTTEIELAVKILDCDERIRNTLSHEMCHLACWIINGDPKENHGQVFHSWAAKVMRAHPDIHISTKHNYDIAYKFEWKCQNCGKIYGRHSKSIRPDECVCGACRVGKLVPLFESAARAPKTPKNKADSQMAAAQSRDSPQSIIKSGAKDAGGGLTARNKRLESITLEDESDDLDIGSLVRVLGKVSIAETRR